MGTEMWTCFGVCVGLDEPSYYYEAFFTFAQREDASQTRTYSPYDDDDAMYLAIPNLGILSIHSIAWFFAPSQIRILILIAMAVDKMEKKSVSREDFIHALHAEVRVIGRGDGGYSTIARAKVSAEAPTMV